MLLKCCQIWWINKHLPLWSALWLIGDFFLETHICTELCFSSWLQLTAWFLSNCKLHKSSSLTLINTTTGNATNALIVYSPYETVKIFFLYIYEIYDFHFSYFLWFVPLLYFLTFININKIWIFLSLRSYTNLLGYKIKSLPKAPCTLAFLIHPSWGWKIAEENHFKSIGFNRQVKSLLWQCSTILTIS